MPGIPIDKISSGKTVIDSPTVAGPGASERSGTAIHRYHKTEKRYSANRAIALSGRWLPW